MHAFLETESMSLRRVLRTRLSIRPVAAVTFADHACKARLDLDGAVAIFHIKHGNLSTSIQLI